MLWGTLTFSSLNWLWPAAGVCALALALLVWSYHTAPRGRLRWLCVTLKALGIVALAVCLLEPLWSGQRARPGANLFAIVADNSEGLRIKDRGESKSRGELLRDVLRPAPNNWQTTIEDHFDVRRFLFDTRLSATRDFQDLNFNGRATALGAALHELKERFTGRPLAGVLLLTDGDATDLHGTPPDLTGLPPIYPVVLGRSGAVRDAAIEQVHVTSTAFEDAPVTVAADVTATGLRGEQLVAQLRDRAGHRVAEQTKRVREEKDALAFRFRFRPSQPGLSFYQVRVALRQELNRTNATQVSQEATLLNNQRVVAVDRGRGPYRILYVAGRPNWEYKFLHRALQSDDQVQLVALIRVALREPKFVFRGRAGETGNPLFRGFGNQSREQVERYDQPVLTRLNTRDQFELRGGFPRTAKELYGYQAVIVDDLEAAFFTPAQAELLQKFVSERGGGFLMLGGMESFRQGHYQHTPIGEMLPVYLDATADLKPPGPVQFNLTREGWLQPWVRLRADESDEKTRREAMPWFQVLNPVSEIKPGANLVATATAKNGKQYPALVTQRFGSGRTAALLIGDLWRWGLHNAADHRDLNQTWRQLARWLVANVPKRVELTANPIPASANGAVRLQVRVRDLKFQPLDDATVVIDVQPVRMEGTNTAPGALRLRAEPSLDEPGLYEARFVPHHTGGYRATAYATNAVGVAVGQAEAGWSSDLAAEEFRSLQPNVALLELIAQRTGGAIVPIGKLASFAHNLPQRKAPVMEAWTTPAWHTPLFFGFALACFVAEWGLRRWKGLP